MLKKLKSLMFIVFKVFPLLYWNKNNLKNKVKYKIEEDLLPLNVKAILLSFIHPPPTHTQMPSNKYLVIWLNWERLN